MLECLESRFLPAQLISPTVLKYQDGDGDLVQATFSQPVLGTWDVNIIFQFNTGDASGSLSTPQQLRELNLSVVNNYSSPGLSVDLHVVQKGRHGDGLVNVGKLTTYAQSLGTVTIQGDLGEYQLWSPGYGVPGIQLLEVRSLGQKGPKNGETSLSSVAYGYVGTIHVLGNASGDLLHQLYRNDPATEEIGTLDIGGSFRGALWTDHGIGTVHIGKNLDGSDRAKSFISQYHSPGEMTIGGAVDTFRVDGSIIGGADFSSGSVTIFQDSNPTHYVQSFQVGGGVIGGAGAVSGYIQIAGIVQSCTINGSIRGGTEPETGALSAQGMGTLTIGGSVTGNKGVQSGYIGIGDFSPFPLIINIKGALKGGAGDHSGYLHSTPGAQSLSIGGITGSSGNDSGEVQIWNGCDQFNLLGGLKGGSGSSSGSVTLYNLFPDQAMNQSLLVKGDIRGGSGDFSGWMQVVKPDTNIQITGSVIGGAGANSGELIAASGRAMDEPFLAWSQLSVGGSIRGGSNSQSGVIIGNSNVGPVAIHGSIVGGAGESSGQLSVLGTLPQVTLDRNITGGVGNQSGAIMAPHLDVATITGSIQGGSGPQSGGIQAQKYIGQVSIGGDLRAGSGNGSGYVSVSGTEDNPFLQSITINGSIRSGLISSTGDIGSVVVHHSILGSASHHAIIEADGVEQADGVPFQPATLASVTIAQDVFWTDFLIGTKNSIADDVASVGNLSVGRNWGSNNLIVGFGAGNDGQYGTNDDVQWNANVPSLVDQIFIQGKIANTSGSTSTYLLLAGQFNSLNINGQPQSLNAGSGNDDFYLAPRMHLLEKFTVMPM
jgi:hypothetical protein